VSQAADLLERSAEEQPATAPAATRTAADLLDASAKGEPTDALTGYRPPAPKTSLQDLMFRDEMSPEAAEKAGKFIAGLPELALSSVTASAGTLADVFTNSPIGKHDWMYQPRTEPGKFTQERVAAVMEPVTGTISAAWDNLFGLGPKSQAIKKEAADDLNIAGSAAGAAILLRGGLGAAAKSKEPRLVAPGESPTAAPQPVVEPIPARAVAEKPATMTASGHPRAAFWEPADDAAKIVDSEPVPGGVDPAYSMDRAQILDRVGLEKARESALAGDAQRAATDWQMKKFDEPAGRAAFEQFEAEKQALNNFATKIVDKTKGTRGLDEETLNSRGQTIAQPFDQLRDWFKEQRHTLYQKADERSGGHPVVQPLSLEEMLGDRSFNNQMTARGQTHFVNGIRAELDRFKEANGGALTVKEAEQFRQFLNTLWTPDTSATIGRLKGALDEDVLKGAGEDIYGPSRLMVQMEKQTLDNPNGIAKLFDVDPKSPINRSTSLEKIPDTLNRLSPDQFSNVIKTLKAMPEQLQPASQSAIAEIKAHLANKIMEAGAKTQGQWNAAAVSDVLRKNSAKLRTAFEDQPEVLAMLQDLDSAGRILKVDQSYPGASAQAANAMKRGFLSHAVSKSASGAGAWAGSSLGPLGTVGGAMGGEYLGSRLGGSMAEKKALATWDKSSVALKELLKERDPSSWVRK